MRLVPPERWPWALIAYAAGGVVVGAAATPLQVWARGALGRAGLGIAISVNVLLPLASIVPTLWYPRVRTAALAGPLVVGGYFAVRVLAREPRFWLWAPSLLLSVGSPILVACAAGCSILAGLIAGATAASFRRVGVPDEHLRCPACGYLMAGLDGRVCPECGRGDGMRGGPRHHSGPPV